MAKKIRKIVYLIDKLLTRYPTDWKVYKHYNDIFKTCIYDLEGLEHLLYLTYKKKFWSKNKVKFLSITKLYVCDYDKRGNPEYDDKYTIPLSKDEDKYLRKVFNRWLKNYAEATEQDLDDFAREVLKENKQFEKSLMVY